MHIDWSKVNRVLVIKLRSIGDTVLLTPSLTALRRLLPNAEIDVLLEDWVAPVLDGIKIVNVVTIGRTAGSRLKVAWDLRRRHYDVVFDQHGGNPASFIARATGARHRVGYSDYGYHFLFNHLVPAGTSFWTETVGHSVERQLALMGGVGVAVEERPPTFLPVTDPAKTSLLVKLQKLGFDVDRPFAVIHPVATHDTKRWPIDRFRDVIQHLRAKGINCIAVGAPRDATLLSELASLAGDGFWWSGNIDLPETTALLSKARMFVGNDSGIAHMAAAVDVPQVVIFGSLGAQSWGPWTDAANEVVHTDLPCFPCNKFRCELYDEPKCILSIAADGVIEAVDRVLAASNKP